MALDTKDLEQIRDIVFEGMQATVEALNPRFEVLEQGQDKLKAAQQEANQRLDNLEAGQRKLETSQKETNRGLAAVEGRLGKLERRFDTFEGKLAAIENDIKELYAMIQSTPEITTKADFKQYAESVILDAHKRLQALAKEAGISLPS